MRKQVRKAIHSEFTRSLAECCPMFEPVGERIPFCDFAYRWRCADNLSFYLCLHFSPKAYVDSFMVDCAWTSGGAPPLRSQALREADALLDGRVRLPKFWREAWESALEPWWDVGYSPESSENEVRRILVKAREESEDAAKRVRDFAVPFFRKIAAQRGVEV